jgi:hypothetical protein
LKTAGWFALTMAASGAVFAVLVVTKTFGRQSIFCSTASCAMEGVLWSLPAYAATLAIALAAVLLTAALERARVGPSALRILAVGTAVAGTVAYVVASIVSLDLAWANAFSGQLSPPPPKPLLPSVLATMNLAFWWLALMLVGVSIALTSLLLLPLRAAPLLVTLGFAAGIGCAALIPYGGSYPLSQYAVPGVFLGVTVWALWLAIFLIRRPPLATPRSA